MLVPRIQGYSLMFLMFIGLKVTSIKIHFKNLLIYRKNINNFELYTYMLPVLSHFSRVQPFLTPWTAARQAPLSMKLSRQEYQSGLPFLSPGDLPDPGTEPRSPTLQADLLTQKFCHWFCNCSIRSSCHSGAQQTLSTTDLNPKEQKVRHALEIVATEKLKNKIKTSVWSASILTC